jgi:sigma-E factor negative regulatory protein RseB
MPKIGLWAGLLALLLLAPASHADADAMRWLGRMQQALNQRNYELSLVVIDGLRNEPLHLTHGLLDGRPATLLTYLNGPPRYVVRFADRVSYFAGDGSAYSVAGERLAEPFPAAFWGDLRALTRNYQFQLAGRNRTVGRFVQLVRVVPRDEQRYGALLWLDEEHGLLLRMDLISSQGELIEQVQVVSASLSEQPAASLKALSLDALPAVQPAPEASKSSPRWALGWLPAGFELRRQGNHPLTEADNAADYYLLSDGLTDLSVYIQAEPQPRDLQQAASLGATSIVTRWQKGVEVAAVGRLPVETLARVVDGVLAGAHKGTAAKEANH